ncbi:hypothetical protein [Demequina mangrovi]|uniref:Uncharacterized protein n=1 Tax=Demequina mangrovi TaxID=1043493 RepID=A0A1H6U0I7_9MICO|nr:hypothetical protein [Demequina mangrovi]SEI85819.1 hypothetical protein SAMN05421637_0208 [Demequina mangrovi]
MLPNQPPAAHHGDRTPEPRVPEASAGGDGAAAPESPRTWIAFVAMALVVVAAVLGWRWFTGTVGPDAARKAAAADGIVVAESTQVDRITAGYRVCLYTGTGDSADFEETDDLCVISPYAYTLLPTTADDGAAWEAFPEPVDGLALRWDPDATPDPLLVVDTGDAIWRVASLAGDDDAAGSFSMLLHAVEFAPAD